MEFRIEEIIQNIVDESNRDDIFSIPQRVAKDAVFTEPFAEQPIIGKEAYRDDIAGLFSYIPDLKFELISLIGKGDQAAFELKYWSLQNNPSYS